MSGYYQLGGHQPDLNWYPYDMNVLAAVVAGNSSPLRVHVGQATPRVELILGIKQSGMSYLLLTYEQAQALSRHDKLTLPRVRPKRSSDFESLSPIYFSDERELYKKLASYKPKYKKGRPTSDNSQANGHFMSSSEGPYRGAFEHGRVLHALAHDRIDPRKFGMQHGLRTARIITLAYNTWRRDDRPRLEQLEHPKILDVGWAEFVLPNLTAKQPSIHLVVSSNQLLGHSDKQDFQHGSTEIVDRSEVSSRLRTLLEDITQSKQSTILLVSDEEATKSALRDLGLQLTGWESGIKKFLGQGQSQSESGLQRLDDSQRRPESHLQRRSSRDYGRPQRSRSRSPARGTTIYPSTGYRPRSPPRQAQSSKYRGDRNVQGASTVYVVDIKQLYIKLLETTNDSENTASMARRLQLSSATGWCAGNEAHLLTEIWRSMIEGPPIDDQRTERTATAKQTQDATLPVTLPNTSDEDDVDPNDIVPVATPAIATAYDPDEDDYGDDAQSESE